jgi:CheY-like chemotaxis protein
MARQRPTKLETLSANMVIETALDVAGYGLRSSGAKIQLDLDPALPPVTGDADQLVQVIANLIVNAEHAMQGKQGGAVLSIASALSPDGSMVRISVSDNGPGIPEAIRARIFEPFFTTKNVGVGTGLGLAFCHRTIETHGGRIRVDEAPGGGAAFTISLTAALEEEDDGTETVTTAVPTARRVLVIDDEPDVAEMIARILSNDGYDVETAASAEAALAILPGEFDLIFSDVNMPGLGGRAFLMAVQDAWPGLDRRIGFITGDTMSPGAEEFLQGAGRPYLEKPVAPAELRRMASDMVRDNEAGVTG